jgi:hypothetical protein
VTVKSEEEALAHFFQGEQVRNGQADHSDELGTYLMHTVADTMNAKPPHLLPIASLQH